MKSRILSLMGETGYEGMDAYGIGIALGEGKQSAVLAVEGELAALVIEGKIYMQEEKYYLVTEEEE
jgi:hypothetical protein